MCPAGARPPAPASAGPTADPCGEAMATTELELVRTRAWDRARLRSAGQTLAGLVGWALFGAGWGRVLGRGVPAEMPVRDGLLIVGLLAVIAAVTTGWIRHNRAIYRRKGPRRAIPASPGHPTHDRLGRTLVADHAAVRAAREVVVVPGDAEKTYEPYGPEVARWVS